MPPQTWGMLACNVSVATIAVASGFCKYCAAGVSWPILLIDDFGHVDLFVSLHKFDIVDQAALAAVVALVSIGFLAEAFKHLEYESLTTRQQESREFFSKLRGFSFKKVEYSQEKVDKNIRRVAISTAHFQGLILFFILFLFLSLRLPNRFSVETSMAASIFLPAFLPWIAAGQ